MARQVKCKICGEKIDSSLAYCIEKINEKYREIAKGEDGFYGVLYELFKPYGFDNNVGGEVEEPTALTRC